MTGTSDQHQDCHPVSPDKLRSAHIVGLVCLTLLVSLLPLLFVPATVKPDEAYHWAYAVHMAQTGSPPPYISPQDPASREAHQPPLYYFLAATLSRLTGSPDAFTHRIANPFFLVTERGNRNLNLLDADAGQLFLVGRLLSLVFWILLPLAVLWAWLPLLGPRASLTVATVVALVPILPFVGTSYSNDISSVTFMAVALGAMLRLLDLERAPRWYWGLLLGLSLGLSMLSKIYAFPLMGAMAVVAVAPCLALGFRRRSWMLGSLALATLMLVPWMIGNVLRFGDPLGMSVFDQIMGRDPRWFELDKVLAIAAQTWRSFWADVGPGGIDVTPRLIAIGLGLLELVALVGVSRWLRREIKDRRHWGVILLLATWAALSLASFAWTSLRTEVKVISGGRNLLYLHLLNVPLLLLGLAEWLRSQRASRYVLVGVGLVLTVWSWIYLVNIYPQPRTEVLTGQPVAALARFGDQYALLDWQAQQADGKVKIEFTLAKLGQDAEHHAYFIQIVAPGGELLANLNTYPAYGVLATGYLPPGAVLHEAYELPAPQPLTPDTRLLLGLWTPPDAEKRLPAYDAAGAPLKDSAYQGSWSDH